MKLTVLFGFFHWSGPPDPTCKQYPKKRKINKERKTRQIINKKKKISKIDYKNSFNFVLPLNVVAKLEDVWKLKWTNYHKICAPMH